MSTTNSTRAVVLGALAASAALLVAAPGPLESLRTLADAGSATDVAAPLVALLALLAWLCAAYLLVVAALTAGSRLPGLAGDALGAVVRVAAPAGLRRALELALGVTLAVGVLGGTAAADTGLQAQVRLEAAAGPAPVVAPPAELPSLDHPLTAAAAPTPSLDQPTTPYPTPSLDHPLTATPAPTPSLDWPGGSAAAPAAAAVQPAAAPAAEQQVVVRPGDSLWGLAEQRIEQQTGEQATDAQVAQAWPSWWSANREAVGDDPDLLLPGTPLRPPAAPPTDS